MSFVLKTELHKT